MSGAIGICQISKLPSFIDMRRKNAKIFNQMFDNYSGIRLQRETGMSSWFGFSILLNEGDEQNMNILFEGLTKHEFEYRPIVAGNFVNNPAINFFNYEIHEDLVNADYVSRYGLFIGNHHYPLEESFEQLKKVLEFLK